MRNRINEEAPQVVARHNGLVLFLVTSAEHAAQTPWFNGDRNVAQNYLPLYLVVKAKQPYVLVSMNSGLATDVKDQDVSPEVAAEIAPLFGGLRDQFADAAQGRGGGSRGFATLRQAVLGGEAGDEGDVAVAEPEEVPGEVPPSRLNYTPKPSQQKGVDPLAGMDQMTAGDVDKVISGARSAQDPKAKKSLQQQALSMMAQESKRRGESRAQCWVRHLLS